MVKCLKTIQNNHLIQPSQFTPNSATYSTWDRFPPSTWRWSVSSPCSSLHNSLHAGRRFHPIFLHWACRCPKQSLCMWLFAFPQAVWFCGGGGVSSRSVSDAWGRSFPPVIFIVWARNIQTYVHVHHIILHWACRCPKQRPCMWLFAFPQVVWFCGGLLKVCSDACGQSFPPAIFIVWARNIQTSVFIESVALPELGVLDLGLDILNR